MTYDTINQPIVSSLVIDPKDYESFFAPVTYQHTGFAFDGLQYAAGTPVGGASASWFSEDPGTFRGGSRSFPSQALVLLSKSNLCIFDTSGGTLIPWMTFLICDTMAIPVNPYAQDVGYSPVRITWACGVLTVVHQPDAGSSDTSYAATHINFVTDQIFFDQAAPVS